MLKRIVLAYGGPGSGKDTLAKFLHTKHNWGHASMSRGLRQVDETFPLLGIMETIERGGIVGLDIVMPAYQLKLAEYSRVSPSSGNLFFQGVLRSADQVSPQIQLATRYTKNLFVVKLDLNDEEMLSRILKRSEGRSDDNEHVARNRISEFRLSENRIDKCIESVVKKYPNVIAMKINSKPSLEQISSQFMKVLTM